MPINRKSGLAAQQNSLVGQIPAPPLLPGSFVNRFPELTDYQTEFNSWWEEFRAFIQRDRDQINSRFQADEAKIKALEDSP